MDFSKSWRHFTTTWVRTDLAWASRSVAMASSFSSWSLFVESKSDFNSSVTVSAICADLWLAGSCKIEHTRGSNIGNELDQAPPWMVETSEPSVGHYYRPSVGSGKQLILHGNPSVIAQDFSPRMSVLRYSRALSEATLTSLLPAVSALLGYSSEKTRSRPIGVRVCPVDQFNSSKTAFDPRAWTLVLFWKESLGRQPVLHHHQNSLSLMLLFLVVWIPVDLLNSLVDLPEPPDPPDFQQDCLQLLHLLVAREQRGRSRPRSPLPERQLTPIPVSDGDDDQPSHNGRQRQRFRSWLRLRTEEKIIPIIHLCRFVLSYMMVKSPFGPQSPQPPAPPEPHQSPGPPSPPGIPPGWPPAPSRTCGGERVGTGNTLRERLHPHPRPSLPEPQLIPIPMSDGGNDDDQPPERERQRQRSRASRSLTYQCRRNQ